MDEEQELKKLREEIARFWPDDDGDYMCEFYMYELSKLLCSDEALARKFFTECTDEEFDMAYLSFEDLAMTYSQAFSFWLLKNATHRNLDLFAWGELHTVLVNSKLWKVDPDWPNWSKEYMKQYVLDAIRKLEAEGNKS